MNKIIAFLALLLLPSSVLAQSPTTPGMLTSVITNDTVTGTTVNKLAKLTAGKAIITATTDTDGAIGVVLSAAGLGGSAQIVTNGVVSCVFDGTATAGDYVQISASVAGDCTDTTSSTRPATGQVIGRVITGGTGAGSYKISLQLGAPGFTFGTGAITALGVNVGTAGSVLVNGGVLGTPSSGTATNLSGTAASLTAGHVTTNANMTGDVTSVGNATTLATGNAGNLNSGTLLAARMPALTGDVTSTVGTAATTLAANARLNSHVVTFTRDISLVTSQAVTGCGFQPTSVVLLGMVNSTATVAMGMAGSDRGGGTVAQFGNAATQNWSFAGVALKLFLANNTAADSSAASISSYDADGFTIAWAKTGSPTGTANIFALCLR